VTDKVHIEAPASLDALDLAQAVAGPHFLLKAEHRAGKSLGRWLAMDQLQEALQRTYSTQIKRLLSAVRDQIMVAAGPLLPSMLAQVQQLIRDYHALFAIHTIHPDIVPDHEQRAIDQRGTSYLASPSFKFVDMAYHYGRSLLPVRTVEPGPDPAKVTLPQFLGYEIPTLSREEKHAVEWARQNAATYVRNLGDRAAHDAAVALIRDKVAENISGRETWRKAGSDIGHASGDWSRDMGRIGATEKQRAMQEGAVAGLKARRKKPGKSIRVAKQPTPDACPDCKRLHLDGGVPIIFPLSLLEANGTNVGRKRASWKAVVGPVHPWCACELIEVPDGWGFDADGNLSPESLTRAGYLDGDLRKGQNGHMTYGDSVPDTGITLRIQDPRLRVAVEAVLARTPSEIFDKKVGITLITTDMPRAQNPLEDHDYAYWTGNEIRLMHNLDPARIDRVLPHEIGHSLNVHLMRKLGTTEAVRRWHDELWKISEAEGFVSNYARKMPIENAAEVSMKYIYDRKRLMLGSPRQFAFCHKDYREVLRPR